jgi:hypothetical protein
LNVRAGFEPVVLVDNRSLFIDHRVQRRIAQLLIPVRALGIEEVENEFVRFGIRCLGDEPKQEARWGYRASSSPRRLAVDGVGQVWLSGAIDPSGQALGIANATVTDVPKDVGQNCESGTIEPSGQKPVLVTGRTRTVPAGQPWSIETAEPSEQYM